LQAIKTFQPHHHTVSVHRRKRGNLQQDQDLHHSWCRTAFLRGLDGLPPGSGRPTSGTWTAFLPGPGRPSAGVWTAYLRDLDGLPPGAWTAFLRGLDGFPAESERPSSSPLTGCLRGQGGLPPAPEQAASVARAPILQLRDRLPPCQGAHPPAPGQAASVPGRPSSSP
jgi:hypothetical protein